MFDVQTVAQDNGRPVLVGEQRGPLLGSYPQGLEEIRGDDRALHLLRFSPSGEVEGFVIPCCQAFKDSILVTPVRKVGPGDLAGLGVMPLVNLSAPDEPAWVWIRQGSNENRVEDAEHRCIRADAERERYHGHCCEAGTSQHRPQAVAHILNQVFK